VVVVQPPWRSRETYGTVQSCGSLCLAAGGVTLMRSRLSTSFIRREQREGIDVVFRIAQVQSVDDHGDVDAALPAHPALGDVDETHPLTVKLAHGALVATPVAAGALVDDPGFFQQPFQYHFDLEASGLRELSPDGQVFEIDEDSDQGFTRYADSSRGWFTKMLIDVVPESVSSLVRNFLCR